MAYKDSQDRESLKPTSNENTKSGRDDQVAREHSKAAFDSNTTRPEQAHAQSKQEGDSRGEDPLEASGANQELSKPTGDEKEPPRKSEEISKGGSSGHGSGEKKGKPTKV